MIRGKNIQCSNIEKVEKTLRASIHNRFDVEVIDAKTGKVKQKAVGHNVICNGLWSKLASNTNYFAYIHYGTGSGTPSTGDTSLFNFLGYIAVPTDQWLKLDRKNCVAYVTCKVQLSETTAAGSTLTEVGIASGTGSSTLVTHAMLKDMNGNNISLEKSSTDIVNIYATIYAHWPAEYSDPNNDINFIPVPYDTYSTKNFLFWLFGYRGSTMAYNCYSMLTTNRFTKYGGTDEGRISHVKSVTATFDASTKKLTLVCDRVSANSGNIPYGAHGVLFFRTYQYQNAFSTLDPFLYLKTGDSWYHHSEIVDESVGTGDGVTKDFATKFDLPSDAIVCVDGVVVDATVDNVPLAYNQMQRYFNDVAVVNGTIFPNFTYRNSNSYSSDSEIDKIYSPYGSETVFGIFENPFSEYGIKSVNLDMYSHLEVSDDCITWYTIAKNVSSSAKAVTIPSEHMHKKYWRITETSSSSSRSMFGAVANSLTGKNIHFATPPASGSVITVSYKTPTIAKDSNHVFDLTVTLQLGEYTEAQ